MTDIFSSHWQTKLLLAASTGCEPDSLDLGFRMFFRACRAHPRATTLFFGSSRPKLLRPKSTHPAGLRARAREGGTSATTFASSMAAAWTVSLLESANGLAAPGCPNSDVVGVFYSVRLGCLDYPMFTLFTCWILHTSLP